MPPSEILRRKLLRMTVYDEQPHVIPNKVRDLPNEAQMPPSEILRREFLRMTVTLGNANCS
jgi:hypothetical protein